MLLTQYPYECGHAISTSPDSCNHTGWKRKQTKIFFCGLRTGQASLAAYKATQLSILMVQDNQQSPAHPPFLFCPFARSDTITSHLLFHQNPQMPILNTTQPLLEALPSKHSTPSTIPSPMNDLCTNNPSYPTKPHPHPTRQQPKNPVTPTYPFPSTYKKTQGTAKYMATRLKKLKKPLYLKPTPSPQISTYKLINIHSNISLCRPLG